MNVYLVRHGAAEDKKPGESDFDRELTEEGKKKMTLAVKGWKNLIPRLDTLVSSPLIRAVQTAEVARKAYGIKEEVIKDNRLMPGSRTEEVVALINEMPGEEIVLFGHEPDFSTHLSRLISNSGAGIDFKKGAIAKIYFQGRARLSSGSLEFLIPVKAFGA
ncbi:MAG: hypothetical protein HF314_01285 [Ignavibacteria bacterium]|nr:hypothetical protein [Ignavibacteria bacterium]MCU7501676.1 hypothetical protein [Ignavibacteria bacterium]MCU7517735.1 hypothetical protein [Ignavibacteria bacterium]